MVAVVSPNIIDSMIAEHVMGLEPWPGKPGAFRAPVVLPHQEAKPCEPPAYSTDIAAAWQIVEKLKLAVGPSDSGLVGWWAARNTPSLPMSPLAAADTAPMAICLAALKVVGVGT